MSSYLFYSSPPPAAYSQQQKLSFLTPQAHRTTPFGAWPPFQPKSPSPLQPSHANAQRRQPYVTGLNSKDRGSGFDIKDENMMQEDDSNIDEPSQVQAHLETPFLGSASSPTTFDHNGFAPTTSASNRSPKSNSDRTPFQFQQRARDSSARSQLSNRATNNRLERKSAFANRLRNIRRDDRDDRHIASFEKAEYWRERRQREERMQRDAQRALGEIAEEIPDTAMALEAETEAAQLSPVSDEKEVEELVNEYYQHQYPMQLGGQSYGLADARDDDSDGDGDSFGDDSGYELAFMEVLSQEQVGRPELGSFGQHLGGSGQSQVGGGGSPTKAQDRDMDMT